MWGKRRSVGLLLYEKHTNGLPENQPTLMDSVRKLAIESQGDKWQDLTLESRRAVIESVRWCVNHQHALPRKAYTNLSNDQMLDIIGECVKEEFGLYLEELQLKTRKRVVVDARDMVMLIYRHRVRATLSEIGAIFNLHHATVIHGIENAKYLIDFDKNYHDKYYSLKNKIERKCEMLSTSHGACGSSPESS